MIIFVENITFVQKEMWYLELLVLDVSRCSVRIGIPFLAVNVNIINIWHAESILNKKKTYCQYYTQCFILWFVSVVQVILILFHSSLHHTIASNLLFMVDFSIQCFYTGCLNFEGSSKNYCLTITLSEKLMNHLNYHLLLVLWIFSTCFKFLLFFIQF